jgi:hypothetical protein
MKTKNPITVLLENGIHFSTLTNMSENQIKILAERFKKEESKEQSSVPANTTPITTTTTEYLVKPNSKTMVNGSEIDTTGGKTVVRPLKETEITEKFESKSQQGLFWAKCNNSKGKEKTKWCKMAKEFSDDTTKKDYKKMPEKIHPEKTVDYKKKSQKESYEKFLEDRIVEMVHNHVNPRLTKGEIKKTIQEKSEGMMLRNPKRNTMFSKNEGMEMKKMGKPIGRMFSAGKTPMDEQGTQEKERTKEKEPGTKNPPKRRGNPFKNPNPGVKEQPRGNSKDDVKMTFMNQIKQALK